MRALWVCCCLGLLVCFGCGGGSSERLGQEKVRLANARADATEKLVQGADPAALTTYAEQMKRLQTDLDSVLDSEKKLPLEEQEAIFHKYDADFNAANERYRQALLSLRKLKAGK